MLSNPIEVHAEVLTLWSIVFFIFECRLLDPLFHEKERGKTPCVKPPPTHIC